MRLLHYIEIENLKAFGDKQRIELDHPAVIVGPNNCGKTTVIQALALWGQAVKTWNETRTGSAASERAGTPLNRLNILNVPVLRTRMFWHDAHVRTGNKDIPFVISVAVEFRGKVEPVAIRFRNQGEDLIYCTLDDSARENLPLLTHVTSTNVGLLHPMSGLEMEEPILQPGRIGVLLGLGQTGQVLRNLCRMVHRESASDWQRIVTWMYRLFRINLSDPVDTARGGIELSYFQDGINSPLSISSAGRGFQQMLLILAYLYSHKRSVVLFDEPDAHLEILRQNQLFVLLRDIANENGSQVVMATHSEIIVEAALDTNLTLLLNGKANNLAKKTDIKQSLKIFGTAHYIRALERGYVFYVEGGTDVDILRALAERMNHHAALVWDENPNVFFVENIHPEPSAESEIERVEGGFGITAPDHFNNLRKLIAGLRGLAILDNDGKNRLDRDDQSLAIRYWKRYEIENYFITPDLLLTFVAHDGLARGLFAIDPQLAESVMDDLVLDRVFNGSAEDHSIWKAAGTATARLIWTSKTEKLKLSSFAEDFFRLLRDRSGLEMILTKGEFHRLVALVDPAAIPKEVVEKLDLLAELFSAKPPVSEV